MYSLWVYPESRTFLISVFDYGKYTMFLNAQQQSVEQYQTGKGSKSTKFK